MVRQLYYISLYHLGGNAQIKNGTGLKLVPLWPASGRLNVFRKVETISLQIDKAVVYIFLTIK